MRRLRVTVRVLSSLLLALIARTIIDGPTVAGGMGDAVVLLLLVASVALQRQSRRVSPDVGPDRARRNANHESA